VCGGGEGRQGIVCAHSLRENFDIAHHYGASTAHAPHDFSVGSCKHFSAKDEYVI